MKPKTICKIATDLLLAVGLLLLMAYELIGQATHEWIGTGMSLLCILHLSLNWRWFRHLSQGKYPVYRVLQTIVTAIVFLSMTGLVASGITLSRHVFRFLTPSDDLSYARTMHMVCAYWGFVFMSLHMGLHLSMLMGVMRNILKLDKQFVLQTGFLRTTTFLIAAYGIHAFSQRHIGSYLFLQNEFAFFDFNEPLAAFFAEYFAIMGLFVCIGYYISKLFRPRISA